MRRSANKYQMAGVFSSIVILLLGLTLAGCGSSSSDIEDRETEATVQSKGPVVPALDESPVSEIETISSSQVSGLSILQEFHEVLVQADGAVVLGKLAAAEAAFGSLVLDDPSIVWSAGDDQAADLMVEGRFSVPLPTSVSTSVFAGDPEGALGIVVAVSGTGDVLSLAQVDESGAFVPLTLPADLSQALAIGGQELFRYQYAPRSDNPCDELQEPTYRSPLDALTTYLVMLGSRTELAAERAAAETRNRVGEAFGDSPSFVDPVTGFVVLASINDIETQLEDADTDAVILRASIPIEITLLPREAASASIGRAMVFIDVEHENVLGWFPLGTQHGFSETTVLEIAPPRDQGDVAVVIRQESVQGTSCGQIGTNEPAMVIPFENLAGETRVAITLETGTYATVTEFELDN